MFPQRDQNQQAVKKQAQVKKQMQLLHMLLPEDGEMDLGDNLLELAAENWQTCRGQTSASGGIFSRKKSQIINGKAMLVALMPIFSMNL